MGLAGPEAAGQSRVTLLPLLNGNDLKYDDDAGHWPEIPERSPCVSGIIPVIYYSVLLSPGLPAWFSISQPPDYSARTRKPSSHYLLALTASDIVTQVVIVFVGFLLQGAMLACQVPQAVVRTANILEFVANHASVWTAVLLTVDHYNALCHPLCHKATSSPGRTHHA